VTYPRLAAALAPVLVLVAVARIVAVFTENVNWDEFALLNRAVRTARTGEVMGGGRPGLGTLVLLPFAAGCRNAVDTLVQARLLWTGMVFASAVAFWYLLRGVLRPSPHRWLAVATGVGLWVLAPPFLRFSTQVRTDQPAILFGLLGALALLASRRRPLWAIAAGVLFGTGFLFSQKLLYVGGLAVTLAAGQLAIRGDWNLPREAGRGLLAAVAFVGLVAGYRLVLGALDTTPTMLPVAGGLSSFAQYREIIGWRLYLAMLPTLLPQVLMVGTLIVLSGFWVRRRGASRTELATAWGVLAVGLVVLLFHAGRFQYFYMVLGLFPAAVGALVVGPALDLIPNARLRAAFLVMLWVPLGALAAVASMGSTVDDQRQQRASLEFVERNFPPEGRGFEGRGAFACRHDPNPFPVRFYQRVRIEFGGEERDERIRALIEEFRSRPVEYMILPEGHGYPQELWQFWSTRYVHYHGAVHVPGREVRGGPGWTGDFEVVVPGEYVWRAAPGADGSLEVTGVDLEPGGIVVFQGPGTVRLRLPRGGDGILVLSLPDPPSPDATPFYTGF
jgi:hypothetical protein